MDLKDGQVISQSAFYKAFGLLINTFIWWYITRIAMEKMLSVVSAGKNQLLMTWAIYYISVISFGFLGSITVRKTIRLRLLQIWIIFGTVTSCLPMFRGSSFSEFMIFTALLFGGSFGFGMPSCLAYFGDSVMIEKRGSKAGAIFLSTNLAAVCFLMILQLFNLSLVAIAVIATAWRGLGLVVFIGASDEKLSRPPKSTVSLRLVFKNRAFMLYMLVWFLFCLIDRFEKPVFAAFFEEVYHIQFFVEPIIGSASALIGGMLMDLKGRKHMAMFGFVILGLAYAIIGITSSLYSFYFHMIMDAIGAGILWVIFILVIWGDLASDKPKETYYFVGSMPFFITDIFRLIISSMLTVEELKRLAYASFSIASFFLFLAVIPLFYVPETLPEKMLKERDLRSYIEKAKRVREKFTKG